MMLRNLALPVVFGCWSCTAARLQPVLPAPQAAAVVESHQVLATVDGIPILRADLQPALNERLEAIDEDAAQKKFQMTWILVEDAIASRLLAQEAQKRNQPVAQLRKAEIDNQVKAPTADEVRALYDQNKDEIGMPFDLVQGPLTSQLLKEREREAERKFVDGLRASGDIRYAIPAPALKRLLMEKQTGAQWGPDNAAVTLVEYGDFECPFCGRARPILARLRELYGDKLKIVFRHFPLPQHPHARQAAEAAACAQEQGKFWPYHDQLFEHSNALTSDDLAHYAQNANLDLAAFQSCRSSNRPKAAVDADMQSAERLGVRGTPAMFLNGGRINGVLPVPLMQSLMEAELPSRGK
jgi:protein-disulfide isomerase